MAPALPEDPATRDLAASLLPDYQLQSVLGAGGMGSVYLAAEPSLRRLVAVKIMASSLAATPELRLRFEREARAAALVSHPNVVQVYRVGVTRELRLPYIVMEYVEGKSLRDVIDAAMPVREPEARRIIGALAGALAAAHRHGLVHRDVKPANVLIQRGTERLYLTDFGVAGALEPETLGEETTLTESGLRVGTPRYMSPEQAAGDKAGPESDVYSLGILAFELLTGKPPFVAPSAALLAAAHVTTSAPAVAQERPDLDPELTRLVDACLAKLPAARPTAAQLASTLLPGHDDAPEWPPAGLEPLLGRGARLGRHAAIVGVAALVVAIGLGNPPEAVGSAGEWWSRFESEVRIAAGSGSSVRRILTGGTGGILIPLWVGALLAGTAALAIGMPLLLWRGASVLSAARRARETWPVPLLRDVLADPDGTGGALRQRVEAGSSGNRAADLLATRRRRSGGLLAGGLLSGLLLLAWCLGLAAGVPDRTGSRVLLPLAPLVALAIPGFLLLSGLALAVRERRLRRGLSGLTRPRESGRAPRVPPPASASLALGVGVLGAVALILVVAAVLVSGRTVLRFGPPTAELADTLQSFMARDPLGRVGAEWRSRIGSIPGRRAPAAGPGDTLPGTINPRGLVEALGVNSRGEPAILAALRRDRATLSADTLGLLERMAVSQVPVAAGEDQDPVTRGMYVNVLEAVLARSRNDPHRALGALARNAAIAESLWSAPDPFQVRKGAGTFQSFAMAPAALIAEQEGDTAGARELRILGSLVQGYLTLPVWETRMLGLAGDALDLGAIRWPAAFPGIPIAYRGAALEGIRDGFCLNPGEIMAGPAPERSQAVAEVARGLGGSDAGSRVEGIAGTLRDLSGRSPGRLVARLRHCGAVGR